MYTGSSLKNLYFSEEVSTMRRSLVLLQKELLDFLSGKAWIIALLLPLFITFLFTMVYRESEQQQFRIGTVKNPDPILKPLLIASDFETVQYPNLKNAQEALEKDEIDGVIYRQKSLNRYTFMAKGSNMAQSATIVTALNAALIRIYSKESIPHIELKTTGPAVQNISSLALPLWLIQIILTTCLLQSTATIAEEKAKHTLHAILVSPAKLSDYFTAKILWNTMIGLASVLLTTWLTRSYYNPVYLISFTALGCLVYTSAALFIGLLSPQPLLARTFSTVLYLISALPLMLKNTRLAWGNLLNFLPTFSLIQGLERAVLQQPWQVSSLPLLAIMAAETVLLLTILSAILKKNIDF